MVRGSGVDSVASTTPTHGQFVFPQFRVHQESPRWRLNDRPQYHRKIGVSLVSQSVLSDFDYGRERVEYIVAQRVHFEIPHLSRVNF